MRPLPKCLTRLKKAFERPSNPDQDNKSNCSPSESSVFPFMNIFWEQVPEKTQEKLGKSISWKTPGLHENDTLTLHSRDFGQDAIVTKRGEGVFDVAIGDEPPHEGLSTLDTANLLISFANDICETEPSVSQKFFSLGA